jgi:hypothetical protein
MQSEFAVEWRRVHKRDHFFGGERQLVHREGHRFGWMDAFWVACAIAALIAPAVAVLYWKAASGPPVQADPAAAASPGGSMLVWEADVLRDVSVDYRVSGALSVSKVIDDKSRTFIYSKGSDAATSLRYVNAQRQREDVDWQFLNGVFVVERVLGQGDSFVLVGGSGSTVIRRK